MPLPLDPKVAEAFLQMDEAAQEFFEERTAITEYMGKLSFGEAEQSVLEETRKYAQSRKK